MTAGENTNGRGFEVNEEALHAYVDGQLSLAESAAVEVWLIAHPERAEEIALWRRQNDALNAMFGPVAAEPVPARLDPHRIADGLRAHRWDWTRMAAVAVVVLALGTGGGWALRTATWTEEPASDRLIDGAVAAHDLYVKESTHAVEVGAADQPHLVSWLSNRIGRPIVTPDLSAQGFALVGGRLLPPLPETGTGPAAQLMYQDGTATRLTVYITAASTDPGKPFETADRGNIEAYYWANDQITCTVVGDLPQAQMQTVAKGVYEQLSWLPNPPARS